MMCKGGKQINTTKKKKEIVSDFLKLDSRKAFTALAFLYLFCSQREVAREHTLPGPYMNPL